mmetsp:Transcript_122065/g.345204  ORF Transcript_122065/g.345204 Transcript_122065/m.345204 type:complete len:95 (-) Transcript_122065:121-405(-)
MQRQHDAVEADDDGDDDADEDDWSDGEDLQERGGHAYCGLGGHDDSRAFNISENVGDSSRTYPPQADVAPSVNPGFWHPASVSDLPHLPRTACC